MRYLLIAFCVVLSYPVFANDCNSIYKESLSLLKKEVTLLDNCTKSMRDKCEDKLCNIGAGYYCAEAILQQKLDLLKKFNRNRCFEMSIRTSDKN